ncbi:MAG TPA: hypothetical protein VNY29_09015 [Terriglobales bacterium]|nr:hypothetical protein [Terriglobales bacterium]
MKLSSWKRLRACALVLVPALLCVQAWSQAESASVERTYPVSVEVIKKSLEAVGARSGRLPMLDGFAVGVSEGDHYEQPYFQYRVQTTGLDGNSTRVKVEAKISAWYLDPKPSRSQYRSLQSNGRLEADLLDRLQDFLAGKSARSAVAPPREPSVGSAAVPAAALQPKAVGSLQEQLDAILAQRQAVREKVSSLQAQIGELHAKEGKPAAVRLASVKRSGVGVMSRMNFGGPVLFRAQAQDEFEVISRESGWALVRLSPDSTGYIQADELNLPDGVVEKTPATAVATVAEPAPTQGADPGFSVREENVRVFSGDWARLRGKKVLFVYVQARGLLADLSGDSAKLAYAKGIFESRYHVATDKSPDVEGVVVVFLGNKGGVAAATLTDIRQWVEGGLAENAFLNRCSLDPPAVFPNTRLN